MLNYLIAKVVSYIISKFLNRDLGTELLPDFFGILGMHKNFKFISSGTAFVFVKRTI